MGSTSGSLAWFLTKLSLGALVLLPGQEKKALGAPLVFLGVFCSSVCPLAITGT